jgi:diguanylate cyclase (GGDEF)-like protein
VAWIREWWVQPDHFRWLSGYLGYRNVRGFTRRMMAVVVAALGIVPVLLVFTPFGPDSAAGRVVSLLIFICCSVMAAMWLRRWPSRRRSVLFVLLSNACLSASCIVNATQGISLLGCTAFAALAGYVAFFHTSHYLALVLSTAGATSVYCVVAMGGGPVVMIAKFLILAVGLLAVPFSVHVLVHLLGDDALKSHTDPLTGLRNRRGFYRSARDLVNGGGEPYLSVIMLDLDRFKAVNDTLGHATGDRILVAVGDKLRRTTRGGAVVARVGGEEFLVAETTRPGEAHALAERLRQQVAVIPWGATASVGVASVRRASIGDHDIRAVFEHLVDAADAAMYEAKRAGGNQTRQIESTEIVAPGPTAR